MAASPQPLATRRVAMVQLGRLDWLIVRSLALVLLLAVSINHQTAAAEQRFRRASAPYSLDLFTWELTHLSDRLGRLLRALSPGPVAISDADRATIRAYFETADVEVRRLARPTVEAAIERALTAILQRQGLVPLSPILAHQPVFPPVSLVITAPPKVLVVSPRDQIRLVRTQLLDPSVDWEQAAAIERRIDDEHFVSLIVPIGGLATYPSTVLDSPDAADVLESAAHEWVHAYLFFTPLGQRYWSDPSARTLNETAADIAGRELAIQLAVELGLPARPSQSRPPAETQSFDLRRALRETRAEVDRLLAAGRVAEAEAYMQQRRLFLEQHGYRLRKLNQAYFAFHGSYADSGAAGANRTAPLLQQLRSQSATLGDFLWQVGQATTLVDIETAIAYRSVERESQA